MDGQEVFAPAVSFVQMFASLTIGLLFGAAFGELALSPLLRRGVIDKIMGAIAGSVLIVLIVVIHHNLSNLQFYSPLYFILGTALGSLIGLARGLAESRRPAPRQPTASLRYKKYRETLKRKAGDCEDAPLRYEKYRPLRPTKEVLEAIVADVLTDLGFHVQTNAKLESKSSGAPIEVDVWAEAPGGNLTVYVSCKNWNKPIDRSKIYLECKRVEDLKDQPHLKIIVVKELTNPAEDVAKSCGFRVIDLGTKANYHNAAKIYQHICRELRTLLPTE
ncbi:MAG: restriction endonuclease [Pyrobaculum sp.]